MSERDRITLTGITATGRHGVFDWERAQGQQFVVDVVLWLEQPAHDDDLASTVDYGAVAQAVAAEIGGPPVQLIESLAERIAEACLGFERVGEVDVCVHKPQAPISVRFTDVSVTIRRPR